MTIVFETIAVVAGLKVITEKNTVHSVFYLVLAFVNTAIIMITWGIDYIGLLVIIVYVGAIAILFVFVVMMINVKNQETNRTKYVPIGIIVTMVMMGEVYIEFPSLLPSQSPSTARPFDSETNIERLGGIMYEWELVMYGGIVLLVAMIGAIVLTISHTPGVRRQDLFGATL